MDIIGKKCMGSAFWRSGAVFIKKNEYIPLLRVSYTMNLNVTVPITSISFVSLCNVVAE